MRILPLLALWTALSIPVSIATGFLLAAGQASEDRRVARVPVQR